MTSPAPRLGRDTFIAAIAKFLSNRDPRTLAAIRETLRVEIDAAGPDALARLSDRLVADGTDWEYYPADPLARRIHHVLANHLLERDSALSGVEHLDAVAGKPVVIFANHLSYSDANLLEVLLQRAGGGALSDRLTVMAGPKVYSSPKRRFSSLCFGTIKTPQNHARSSEEAVMNVREVARAARKAIVAAHERLRLGDALVVFGEGTRSRTRGMQAMLPGVSRYLDGPAAWVLPVGIVGTEALFPIGEDTLHPVRILTSIGRPIAADTLRAAAGGDRRLMMDCVGLAIADLLPPAYRGAYDGSTGDLDEARRLRASVCA